MDNYRISVCIAYHIYYACIQSGINLLDVATYFRQVEIIAEIQAGSGLVYIRPRQSDEVGS